MMKSERIRQVINERNIPYLVHFTNVSNLESIFTLGLVSRQLLDVAGWDYQSNDKLRLDGHEDSISLSVGFPNSRMLYKLWQSSSDKFCVLALDPELLVRYESAFCKHNAADPLISRENIDNLKTADAFEGMFNELSAPYRSRADQKLKDYDPTDVQAEILVFDAIPVSCIAAVVFPDLEMQKQYQDIIGDCPSCVHEPNKRFYASRSYNREYC